MSPEAREKPSPPPELERMVHSQVAEEVRAAAMDRSLTEDLALSLLTRRDLQGPVLEELSRNMAVMKHRKVIVALVCHPRTPRYVSLPIARLAGSWPCATRSSVNTRSVIACGPA